MFQKKKNALLTVIYYLCNVVACGLLLMVLLVWFRREEYGNLPVNLAMVAVSCGTTYVVCLFAGKINCKEEQEQIILSRLKKSIIIFRNCLACVTLFFAVFAVGKYFLTPDPMMAQVEVTGNLLDSKPRVKKKLVQSLKIEVWQDLCLQDKVDLMQIVANLESDNLGMTKGVKVVVAEIAPYIDGQYVYPEGTIYLHPKLLEKDRAWEALETICHEQFHAYQYKLAELYNYTAEEYRNLMMFDKIEQYCQELINYVDISKSFEAYYEQTLERDARQYAKERLSWYSNLLSAEE